MSSEVTISSPRGFRQSIPLEKLQGFRRLAVDYTANFGALAPFFTGDPSENDAWTNSIARVRAHARETGQVADVLAHQLGARQAPAEAQGAVEHLRDPEAIAIVTGQQAGLFGGPLFTLLKALTATRLAADVTSRFGVTCVPLFWVDAEDHDWDEVRTCSVLGREFERQAISLPAVKDATGVPVGARVLDDSIAAAIDELSGALTETEFTASLVEQLRGAYAPGVTMAEAFCRWMDSLFGERGLVVFDASDQAAKPLVADVFVRELESAGRTSQLAAEAGERLSQLGYQVQVTPQPDSVALFRLDGGRQSLKSQGDVLTWGQSRESSEALAADARQHPEHYSPNVLLRPVVQDSLFPTVAYVAGPSELAYLGQLRGVYDHFGVPMPLVCPRATATILDSGAVRFLNRYDVAVDTLQSRDELALNQLLQAQLPASVEASFENALSAIREHLANIGEAVTAVDPTLAGTAKSTLSRMEKDMATFRNKMIHAAKRRDETMRRQFERTQSLLFPDGQLQERALGFVYFLNRYGPALSDRLEAALPLRTAEHTLVTI